MSLRRGSRLLFDSSRTLKYGLRSVNTWRPLCFASTQASTRLPSKSRFTPTNLAFHTSASRSAESPTADSVMESLNDLYSTAKDEFEIAAEETEKKTVYAADDREAAKAALNTLKEAFEKAVKETAPEVAKEVQTRTGPRIRELENAVTAMEEMAMED